MLPADKRETFQLVGYIPLVGNGIIVNDSRVIVGVEAGYRRLAGPLFRVAHG